MKHVTIDDIWKLQRMIREKTTRINSLTEVVNETRACYKDLDDKALYAAVKDVQDISKEIAADKAWIKKAKAKINAFYKPASMVA